ncbi:MAG: methionine--tRNA ligase [Nitrososphaeraceae archaeon]|nr:methionine--tRNA ligase [Nitrososphaeraceae archaeon]
MKNNNEVITMDDFLKIKMKLGKIIEAEKIEGMKKILKIRVDIGNEIREIGAGIALFYNPEDIIGKTVVVLTNLQPRKLGNLISNGMILAADGPDGKPLLLTVEDKDPILGSEIH